MIQVESMKSVNFKVEVCHLSFPKSPRSSKNITWARGYGSMNKACCNCFQKQIFSAFSHVTRFCFQIWPLLPPHLLKIRKNIMSSCLIFHIDHKFYPLACEVNHFKIGSQVCQIAFMCNSGLSLKQCPRAKFYPKHSRSNNKLAWWALKCFLTMVSQFCFQALMCE